VIARRRPGVRDSLNIPSGYLRLGTDSSEIYLKQDFADHAGAIVAALHRLRASGAVGLGNRGGGFRVELEGLPPLFVRHCRRGGLFGAALGDLFFGLHPRPLRELVVAEQAARRGIPTAEPLGAMVMRAGSLLYRGFFLTRVINGMSLWDFLRTDDDPVVRDHVLKRARSAIALMHEQGLYHADLNLHNLIVTAGSTEDFAVVIVDLDKARLLDRPVSSVMKRRNLARLRRSARKLDPTGRLFDARGLAILCAD
jgi:hypothetical protein